MSDPNPLDHIDTGIADDLLDNVGSLAAVAAALPDPPVMRLDLNAGIPPHIVVRREDLTSDGGYWAQFLDRMPYVRAARAALQRMADEQMAEISGGFPPPRCGLGQDTDDPCGQIAFEIVRIGPSPTWVPLCYEHADLVVFVNQGEGYTVERRAYNPGPGLTPAELAAEPG